MNRTARSALVLLVVASLGACVDQAQQPPPQSGYNAGYGAPGYGQGYGAPGYGAPGYGPGAGYGAPPPAGGYPPAPTATAPGGYGPAPTATAPGGYGPAPTATAPAPAPTTPAPAPTTPPPAGTTPPPAGTAPGGFPWPFPFPAPTGTGAPPPAPAPGGQAPAGGSAQPIDPSLAQAAIGPLMLFAQQEAPGMQREGNPAAAQFKEGQTFEVPFQMLPGKCYAVLAVGVGVQEVDLSIQTVVLNVANTVAQDTGTGNRASVGGRGNCFKWVFPAGVNAKYVIRATKGEGIVAGQLYVK